MVRYDQLTEDERDRFISLNLSEEALKAIVIIMKRRYGNDVSTDRIMRFAYKVALRRITPRHLRHKITGDIA